jgi:V/A-type H+-transporting ATPase subunit C
MKKTSPLNYAFAIGRIRALEKFLISSEVFSEAIESNLQEALRLFAETDLYSDELLHIRDSQHLEAVLNQELIKLKKLIQSLLLDEGLWDILELKSVQCLEEVLKNYRSEFLENYLKHLIDMHNIKTFLRFYILKEPEEKLQKNLVGSGFISHKDFLKLYAEGLTAFLNHLEYVRKDYSIVDYAIYLRQAIEKIEKDKSFVALEKAINDFLIQVLKPAKYLTFGPEPVLAYYFAKVNEINLIRMIILAKLNDVLADLVKERLNLVYA